MLYLQYKWANELENQNINYINSDKNDANESHLGKDIYNKQKIEADSSNKKSEKINEKFFNNSSMMISEIKENTDKSNYSKYFFL